MTLHSVRVATLRTVIAAFAGLALVAATPAIAQRAQNDSPDGAAPARDRVPVRFTALAVAQGGRQSTLPVEILVQRWSTDKERDGVLDALTEQGSSQFLSALSKLPRVGSFSTPGSVGYDIRLARHVVAPGSGEKITLITDRPMSFVETANQTRSTEYPFTVISLTVKPDGTGTGSVTLATKITMDRDTNTIVMENYDIKPVQLTGVRRVSR
jgi:hypothetical protein